MSCWIGVSHADFLNRNHWSLYPVVFQGRDLSPDAYDELMGILTHGCIGEYFDPTSVIRARTRQS